MVQLPSNAQRFTLKLQLALPRASLQAISDTGESILSKQRHRSETVSSFDRI
jgi:hypothetical protein